VYVELARRDMSYGHDRIGNSKAMTKTILDSNDLNSVTNVLGKEKCRFRVSRPPPLSSRS
jgi:hypothetical protein